jgi:hypothetical protein
MDRRGEEQVYAFKRDYIVNVQSVRRTADNRVDADSMFSAIARAHTSVQGSFVYQDFA